MALQSISCLLKKWLMPVNRLTILLRPSSTKSSGTVSSSWKVFSFLQEKSFVYFCFVTPVRPRIPSSDVVVKKSRSFALLNRSRNVSDFKYRWRQNSRSRNRSTNGSNFLPRTAFSKRSFGMEYLMSSSRWKISDKARSGRFQSRVNCRFRFNWLFTFDGNADFWAKIENNVSLVLLSVFLLHLSFDLTLQKCRENKLMEIVQRRRCTVNIDKC